MNLGASIIAYAAPYNDPGPWRRATSYSFFGHASLMLFFTLVAINVHRVPTTILTEVKFIEREVESAPVEEKAAKDWGQDGPFSADTVGTAKKAPSEIYTSGQGPVRVGSRGSEPSGKGSGAVGGNVPLSGPIVADEPMGWIGRKAGALVELPTRKGGTVGSGGGRGKTESAGAMAEPMALSRLGVDDIRKTEEGIGAPVISGSVVAGSLGGRGKGLAGGSGLGVPGERRKATSENLRSNPLDSDKWGKDKGPFSMEGPLKYRKILRMELPPYPRWAEERALEAAVSIRLWVNPKGKVLENMYLEKTSGYSELDHLAMEALKKFLFVNLPDNQAQDDEWGVATFRFELRK